MTKKISLSKANWLVAVHNEAERLFADPDYEKRFAEFLRDDQIGKWRLDSVTGYYWYLHALVSVVRPKKVLELGRCLGTSALFMLGALSEDSILLTVDIEDRATDLAHFLGDPRLTVITGNDLDLSIYDNSEDRKIPYLYGIDFLFIDTDHTFAQASKEWELYKPYLSEQSLVVFDDITMNDMGRFWDDLPCPKLETGTKYHYTGFGLAAP